MQFFEKIEKSSNWDQGLYEVISEFIWPLFSFSGKARDILLRQSRIAQFYQDLGAKALLLVPPTELEIFYQDFAAKG